MRRYIKAFLLAAALCAALAGCEGSAGPGSGELLDLTRMSDTVRTAEMQNIMNSPHRYLGMTITVSGTYASQYIPETDEYYHFVCHWDDTNCCMLYIEFAYNNDRTYPGEYPEWDREIIVSGVYESYRDGDNTFFYINADTLEVLE